jgi:choline kinase
LFNSDITIIIPVAGYGRRTKSHGPKCLLEVEPNTSLLKRQLRLVQNTFSKAQIVVVAGFKFNKILTEVKRYNMSEKVVGSSDVIVIENSDFDTTNVARSISIGLSSKIIKDSLIIYGDLVFSDKMLKTFNWENSNVLVDNNKFMDAREVGVVCCDGNVTNMSYSLPTKWCHMLYLNKKDAALFASIEKAMPKTCFGFEIINEMINKNINITYTLNNNWLVEVDTMKDLLLAKESIKKYENSNI